MLSIILPVHNEAAILRDSVAALEGSLRSLGRDYEMIIAEDGSTDDCAEIARSLASRTVRPVITAARLGRGRSLTNAFKEAKGDTIAYLDADLATDLVHLKALVEKMDRGADICIGSRLIRGSKVEGRSAIRELSSKGYNLLLRILFGSKVHDHQCGFKAFRKSSVLPLLEKVKDNHWFWDSELLILAQRQGLKVEEIPVSWNDRAESRVRLGNDILYMGLAALRLRCQLCFGKQ
ncbi:MAG: glycosyltransferase [Candidatus Micrarchaeota archaeon]